MTTFWRDRPVLVTGATGLLGSWLVPELERRGAAVVALVRDFVPASRLFERTSDATLVFGDIRDGALVERVLAEYEIDAVFHLAAQTIVEHGQRDPRNTLRSNVEGTWEVLDACRRSGRPTRIVVASSDKAYGDQPVLPYTESSPLEGRHPYDVSKSCADLIAQAYAVSYGLPVAITRCGNLYGGGDLNWNRLIPGSIRELLAGRAPQLRSDGRAIRDYLYVEDAVSAYLAVAERAHEASRAGSAWNISTETPLSALEMATRITAACGRPDLRPEILGTARHEIKDQFLSAARIRDELGWRPAYDVDQGLARTVEWYREHLGAGARAVRPAA
jgi:CDP-glucose 4,6-dehydratase